MVAIKIYLCWECRLPLRPPSRNYNYDYIFQVRLENIITDVKERLTPDLSRPVRQSALIRLNRTNTERNIHPRLSTSPSRRTSICSMSLLAVTFAETLFPRIIRAASTRRIALENHLSASSGTYAVTADLDPFLGNSIVACMAILAPRGVWETSAPVEDTRALVEREGYWAGVATGVTVHCRDKAESQCQGGGDE